MGERIKNFLVANKKWVIIFALFLFGIVMLISSASSIAGGDDNSGSEELTEYKARLEKELSDICSSVKGVGKCRVMVTFERGEENTYKGTNLIESKPPKVLGVTVVCKGADSDEVRAELVKMMSALFDIGANRVSVLKLS